MLATDDLDYPLPPGAVATHPAEPRDSAKLMVVSRSDESMLEHAQIKDAPRFFRKGDCIIVNSTRVLAARLEGKRPDTGGKVGGLYLRSVPKPAEWAASDRAWIALLSAKSLREGIDARFGGDSGITATLIARQPDEVGAWLLKVSGAPADEPDDSVLAGVGLTPLPPYILKARRDAAETHEDSFDRDRYQTVFASSSGSVAAPTAGLHFTPAVLENLASRGVNRAEVLLHVGTGTFRTVETKFVEEHPMHSEWCEMSVATRDRILATRQAGGRVFCVGTTSARTVESMAANTHLFSDLGASMDTRLLITPGYQFLWTDGLLTNFHLPRSTLLAMVAALLPGGISRLRSLYSTALEHGYRFFSYGDAMLILP